MGAADDLVEAGRLACAFLTAKFADPTLPAEGRVVAMQAVLGALETIEDAAAVLGQMADLVVAAFETGGDADSFTEWLEVLGRVVAHPAYGADRN